MWRGCPFHDRLYILVILSEAKDPAAAYCSDVASGHSLRTSGGIGRMPCNCCGAPGSSGSFASLRMTDFLKMTDVEHDRSSCSTSIPLQIASALPTSRPDLPTCDFSIRSERSFSLSTSLSIASLFQWLGVRRRSFRNTRDGCSDTYWRSLRFRRSYVAVRGGRCCWSYRCRAC